MINKYEKLINKVRNNYNLIFHKHWVGFKDKEYKELIKFEDPYNKFYLWIYIIDGNKAHKVEIRDYKTADVIAEASGDCTPLQVFRLVKEVMSYV